MALQPPLKELSIGLAEDGFYKGFNSVVALASKIIIALVVLWCLIAPESAAKLLGDLKNWSFANLNYYYTWGVAFYVIVCLVIAIHPKWGKTKLGTADGRPEFSNFSWFSMMFGAGLGVGLMVFATAEPLGLWGSNPLVLSGEVAANSEEAVKSAYRYTFLHYGFHAWAIYVLTGLSLAFGESSGGFRRLVQIVFGLSIAFAATSFFLSFFSFGGGALVA